MKDVLRRKVRQSQAYAFARKLQLEARMLQDPKRRLPDFLVVGAHKGGTSSFYKNFCTHPQIMPAWTKEVRYFERPQLPTERWYRAHFPTIKELKAVNGITGEASPSYNLYPMIPERVKACVPNTKIIMMLRDPVSRAYSSFQFNQRRGDPSDRTFEDYIDMNFDRIGHQPIDVARFHELYAADPTHQFPTGILHGLYITQIENWLKFFPKEQLVILNSADYFADPKAFMNGVAQDVFGLPPFEFTYQKTYHERRGYEKMKPETKARLQAYYKPYNEALYAYLGKDLGWS